MEKEMRKKFQNGVTRNLTAMSLIWAMLLIPIAAIAQTRIAMPKNKYRIEQDVEVGRKSAAEVEQQMPVLNDYETTRYIQNVGQRLVNAIPAEFQHPEFQYTFKVINASDINAFALPGGPMYVNRGMIEAAKNEGEMAGVMAHEISHVALRHGTAGATKQGGIGTQLGVIGMILGGAILGGEAGAQLGMLGAQAWLTKYSREYETQADILGSQIMARAGYDPRDLANMFQTIARQSNGQRAPQWLSSHPDPGNRYNNINREAQMLRVSPEPIKVTQGFRDAQAKMRTYGPAPTMAQIEQNAKRGGTTAQNPTAGGTYSRSVPYPSRRLTEFSQNGVYIVMPDNWRSFQTQDTMIFAPEGAYGSQGITHGLLLGVGQSSGNFSNDANNLAQQLARDNGYQLGRGYRTTLNGTNALAYTMSGVSNVRNETESAVLYIAPMQSNRLLYVVTVAPQREVSAYNSLFQRMVGSLQVGR